MRFGALLAKNADFIKRFRMHTCANSCSLFDDSNPSLTAIFSEEAQRNPPSRCLVRRLETGSSTWCSQRETPVIALEQPSTHNASHWRPMRIPGTVNRPALAQTPLEALVRIEVLKTVVASEIAAQTESRAEN